MIRPDIEAALANFQERKRVLQTECEEIARYALALEVELSEAKSHARQHVPSIDRIREAHTQMPLDAMSAGGGRFGHRVYGQGEGETCYLCALIIHAEKAEARAKELEAALESIRQLAWDAGKLEPPVVAYDLIENAARIALKETQP